LSDDIVVPMLALVQSSLLVVVIHVPRISGDAARAAGGQHEAAAVKTASIAAARHEALNVGISGTA
jgi:hypothetical protein